MDSVVDSNSMGLRNNENIFYILRHYKQMDCFVKNIMRTNSICTYSYNLKSGNISHKGLSERRHQNGISKWKRTSFHYFYGIQSEHLVI